MRFHTIQDDGNLLAMLFIQDIIHQGGFTGSKVPFSAPLTPFRQQGLEYLPVTIVMGTLTGFDSSRLSFAVASTSTNIGGPSSSSNSIVDILKLRSKVPENCVFFRRCQANHSLVHPCKF